MQLGIAVVQQELSLAPHLSIAENIGLGAYARRGGVVDYGRLAAAVAEIGRELELVESPGHAGRAIAPRPPADRRDRQGALYQAARPHLRRTDVVARGAGRGYTDEARSASARPRRRDSLHLAPAERDPRLLRLRDRSEGRIGHRRSPLDRPRSHRPRPPDGRPRPPQPVSAIRLAFDGDSRPRDERLSRRGSGRRRFRALSRRDPRDRRPRRPWTGRLHDGPLRRHSRRGRTVPRVRRRSRRAERSLRKGRRGQRGRRRLRSGGSPQGRPASAALDRLQSAPAVVRQSQRRASPESRGDRDHRTSGAAPQHSRRSADGRPRRSPAATSRRSPCRNGCRSSRRFCF